MKADELRLLKQTIAVQSSTALDSYGKPTWGTAATRAAYVEPKSITTENTDGTKLTTSWLVIVAAEVKITDRLWMPADVVSPLSGLDSTKANLVKDVQMFTDETGATDHYEVRV